MALTIPLSPGAARWLRVTICLGAMLAVKPVAAIASVPPAAAITILASCSLLLAIDLLRALDFDRCLIGIVLVGVAAWLGYLSYTDPSARAYDAFDQLSYVRFIEQNGQLPPAKYCRICHHPPLYYLVAALWVHIGLIPSFLLSQGKSLQVLGLLVWFGFVVFAILIVKRYVRARPARYLAAALLVFWPYGIMSSVRIGNDGLTAGLVTAALYFMLRWFEDRRGRALYWATLLSGLGLLTKSSAHIVVGTLLCLLAWRYRTGSSLRKPATAVALLGGSAWLGASNKIQSGQLGWCQSLLGSVCDALRGGQPLVGNSLINYLYFDVPSFVSEPFMHVYRPETGHDYFWNSLLKSSLFGTYSLAIEPRFAAPRGATLALAINVLLLGMVLYVLLGLGGLRRAHLRRYRVLLLFGGVSLAFLAGFRAIVPMAHHADFRFVLPLLVPGCLFYALSVHRFRDQNRVLQVFGYALGMAFIMLTLVLFFPSADRVLCGGACG